MIRPEIYQYFIESDTDGKPFGRDQRSLVYQRAKNVRDTIAFGTLKDLYQVGYEWVNHSLRPLHLQSGDLLKDPLPATYKRAYNTASAETFAHVQDV